MDRFYDGMIFHRIVGDFLIQTGALRGADKKSSGITKDYETKIELESVMDRRRYETHSRLRFNHRGQVAMALGVGDEDDKELQPQFFITLDEAPYLDEKHVLFGSCIGDTIYNALRIGKLAVDDDNMPVDIKHAPRIIGVTVIENPIHLSLTASSLIPWLVRDEAAQKKKKKKKRKGKKDLNVLSFGDEMDGATEDNNSATGIGSSHDVVSNKNFSNAVDATVKKIASGNNDSTGVQTKELETPKAQPGLSAQTKTKTKLTMPTKENKIQSSLIKNQTTSGEISSEKSAPNQPKLSIVEARLAKFKQNQSKNKRQREEDTMVKLMDFQNKVRKNTSKNKDGQAAKSEEDNDLASRMARKTKKKSTDDRGSSKIQSYHGQVLDDDDIDNNNWINTNFKCKKHIDSNLREGMGGDGRSMHDYQVIDEKDNNNRREERKNSSQRSRLPKHHRKNG